MNNAINPFPDEEYENVKEDACKRQVDEEAAKVSENKVKEVIDQESNFIRLFSTIEALMPFAAPIKTVFSLLKDSAAGKYSKCEWRTIAILVGMLAYVLMPFDLVPDFIPLVGWSDDAMAVALSLVTAKEALDAYQKWQDREKKIRNKNDPSGGAAVVE